MDGDAPAAPVIPAAGAGSKKGEDLVVLARIRCGGIVPPRGWSCQCCSSCSASKAFSASRARAAAAAMASWVSKNMCVPFSGCSFPFWGRNGRTHVQRGLRRRASPWNIPRGRKGVKRTMRVAFVAGRPSFPRAGPRPRRADPPARPSPARRARCAFSAGLGEGGGGLSPGRRPVAPGRAGRGRARARRGGAARPGSGGGRRRGCRRSSRGP